MSGWVRGVYWPTCVGGVESSSSAAMLGVVVNEHIVGECKQWTLNVRCS